MVEYAKKKNDELSALCKERGLAHNGKKADLVKRLEEYDAQAGTSGETGSKGANEDEIDWDEEPAADAPKDTSAASKSAGPSQAADIKSSTNDNSKDVEAPPETTDSKPAAAAAAAAASSTEAADLAKEIEKRKARARRFGLPEDSEEIKKLERAQKYGSAGVLSALDKELTTDRKRRRPETEGDSNKKTKGQGQSQTKTAHAQASKQEKTQANAKPADKQKSQGASAKTDDKDGYPAWMTAEDREKAEKRKARFGQTSSNKA